MANLRHSERAKRNMTDQLKAQWKFLQDDLKSEKRQLKKAKSFLKWDLPGTKSMIQKHEAGIRKTERDIESLRKRILEHQRNGGIFKIL